MSNYLWSGKNRKPLFPNSLPPPKRGLWTWGLQFKTRSGKEPLEEHLQSCLSFLQRPGHLSPPALKFVIVNGAIITLPLLVLQAYWSQRDNVLNCRNHCISPTSPKMLWFSIISDLKNVRRVLTFTALTILREYCFQRTNKILYKSSN